MSKRRATGSGRLIRAGEDGLLFCRLSAVNALAGATRLFERNTAHGCSGFFLDIRLAFAVAAPPGKRETLFDRFLELFVAGGLGSVSDAKSKGTVVERLLDFLKQPGDACGQILLRDEGFPFF